MPKIGYYDLTTAANGDLVLISDTDVNGVTTTKTVTAQSIAQLAGATGQNLEATLGFGNVATNDITLNGDQLVNGTLTVNVVDIAAGDADNLILGANIRNTAAVTTLDASGLTALATDLTVGNDTAITNDLGVGGNTTIIGTLGVTGDTTLSANAGVTGNTTIGGTLGVTGVATLATVDINAGAIDGTPIGAGVASTINCTTLAATGAITSGGDIAAGNAMSFTVDPTGGGGPIVGLECRSNTGCNITFHGVAPAFPTETHIKASGGITLDIGPADRVSIASTGAGLIEYTGATFSNAAIDAAPATVLVTKGWVENPAAPVVINTGGDDYTITGLGTSGVVMNDAAPAAGCTLDVGGTQGSLAPPSLTVAQAGVLDPTLAKAGSIYYNSDQNAMRVCSTAGASTLAFQPHAIEVLNAGNTPLSAALGSTEIHADTSGGGGTLTVNLQQINTNVPAGTRVLVIDTGGNAFARNVIVVQNAADTISGSAANKTISKDSGRIILESDGGTNWLVINEDIDGFISDIKTISGTLTQAEILLLAGTPIQILPATASVTWQVLHCEIVLLAAAAANGYAGLAADTTLQIMGNSLGGTSQVELDCLKHFGTSPGVALPLTSPGPGPIFAAQYQVNTALEWTVAGVNPTFAGPPGYDITWNIVYATIRS